MQSLTAFKAGRSSATLASKLETKCISLLDVQIIDPAHVPHAHHGVQGNRFKVSLLQIASLHTLQSACAALACSCTLSEMQIWY